jgi:hypothetical protein
MEQTRSRGDTHTHRQETDWLLLCRALINEGDERLVFLAGRGGGVGGSGQRRQSKFPVYDNLVVDPVAATDWQKLSATEPGPND